MKFLKREIKEDSKGLYVHYGGFRIRPEYSKTKFSLDDTVSLSKAVDDYYPNGVRIFRDADYYEFWRGCK
jgi:hypothetical protein